MLLRFSDPATMKTQRVVFEDAYHAEDSGTLEQLKELSARRKEIEKFFDEKDYIDLRLSGQPEEGIVSSQYQHILEKMEQYMPLLENLKMQVERHGENPEILDCTSDLNMQWSSPLSATSFFNLGGPKFFCVDDLQYELGMILFLYGAILRESALEILPKDAVQSATLYRTAAGVYRYLSDEALPKIHYTFSEEMPPEAAPPISLVMSLICLAEAQAVTTKRAEEKGNSKGLLAKLHYGVSLLLDEANRTLISYEVNGNTISRRFKEYISSCKAIHEFESRRNLLQHFRSIDELGLSIGIARHALEKASANIPINDESWRIAFTKELDSFGEILKRLERENEAVYHDKVPCAEELPCLQDKRIVSIVPYVSRRWERTLLFQLEED